MTPDSNGAAATRPQHVVITGASSGIGAALARVYAQRGNKLTLFARNSERLELVAQDCRLLGADPRLEFADVTDLALMHRTLTAYDEACAVDLIVANAGIGGDSAIASRLRRRSGARDPDPRYQRARRGEYHHASSRALRRATPRPYPHRKLARSVSCSS